MERRIVELTKWFDDRHGLLPLGEVVDADARSVVVKFDTFTVELAADGTYEIEPL